MNNPFTKYKKLEQIRKENQKVLDKIDDRLSKVEIDYFGSAWRMTYGFKSTTELTLKQLSNALDDATKRVKELENVVRLSGIVEELDTTDVVELPNNDPYHSPLLGERKPRKYVVNQVK